MWGRVRERWDEVLKRKNKSWCVVLSASWYKTTLAGVLYKIKPQRFPLLFLICQMSEGRPGDMPKSWLICQNPG